MKNKIKRIVTVLLLCSLLLSILPSCKSSDLEDADSASGITTEQQPEETTAETEPSDDVMALYESYRQHDLDVTVFGDQFYSDATVNIEEISSILYKAAGEPDILTDEYIAFYDRLYAGSETAQYGVIPSRSDWSYWGDDVALEWANTRGIVFMGISTTPSGIERYRMSYKWGDKVTFAYSPELFSEHEGFTRGDIVMCMYFFAEELELDLTERKDISIYGDGDTVDSEKMGLYSQSYTVHAHEYTLEEESYIESISNVKMSELWSWAEACGMIVWGKDGSITQNELSCMGEFADMVEAFMTHYGIEP